MFKRISIELAGPICDCEEQDLAWGIGCDEKGRSTLELSCRTCGTKLIVPNKKFVARFDLEVGYPGKKKEEPKPRAKPDGDGTVVPLFPKEQT